MQRISQELYWIPSTISNLTRAGSDLGTEIQLQPEPVVERLFLDYTTVHQMASLMLSAATKRQYSSVLPLLSLPVF